MSNVPAVWTEQRLVESFEVDMNGRLKPHVLFAYLTNSAWKHASLSAAYGYDGLSALNQMWVLVKFQLRIERLPRWGDQIAIETWGKGTERLYALRDYIVTLVDGEKLASATSAWLILDKERRRPVRIDEVIFPMTGRTAMETDVQKVPKLVNGEARARFRAFFSDIDVNKHVTAMKYLQWMMDSHAQAVLQEKQPRSIELSFLAEAVIGDEVTVYSEVHDGFELSSVVRASDETELCRARIAWE